MVGASLIHRDKLYFGVFGDLAFFYDMNVLGNRHIGNNLRIMLINNGKGNEFHNFNQNWSQFGDYADVYGAAGGHFGCKSPDLVRHYAEDLEFEYLTASDMESFLATVKRFVTPELTGKSILFEVFLNGADDSEAYQIMRRLVVNPKEKMKNKVVDTVRQVMGDTTTRKIADILKLK